MQENPFSDIAVSKYPPDAEMIGQKTVFNGLKFFIENSLNLSNRPIDKMEGSRFFILSGEWGAGKTRLAHELIAEYTGRSLRWIINGESTESILSKEKKVLPLYIAYRDVIDEDISADNVLEKMIIKSLESFKNPSALQRANIYNDLKNILKNNGCDVDKLIDSLKSLIKGTKRSSDEWINYVKKLKKFLETANLKRLLIIVDEIEMAGYETPYGVEEGIRKRYIDMLPIAMQSELNDDKYPYIDFMFLCSEAAFRHVNIEKIMEKANFSHEALERRITERTLKQNEFKDVKEYINRLSQRKGINLKYPGKTIDAVFLAVNQNMGYFIYAMNRIHSAYIESKYTHDYQLMKELANRDNEDNPIIIDKRVIKNIHGSNPYRNLSNDEKVLLDHIIFRMSPTSINELGVSDSQLSNILNCRYPVEENVEEKIIAKLVPVKISDFSNELTSVGFQADEGSGYIFGGCRIEPSSLLESFKLFSYTDERDVFLIYEDLEEFRKQLCTIYGVDGITEVADKIYSIFMNSVFEIDDTFVAPSFSLLTRMNKRLPQCIEKRLCLKDRNKEENLNNWINSLIPIEREKQICIGLCKLRDVNPNLVKDFRLTSPHSIIKLDQADRLNLTEHRYLVIIKNQSKKSTFNDIKNIMDSKPSPIILLFGDERTKEETLSELNNPYYEIHIIPHVIDSVDQNFLLKYAARREIFKGDDDLTFECRRKRDELNEKLNNIISKWINKIDMEGYLLKPIIRQQHFESFLKGYKCLVEGKTYEEISDPNRTPDLDPNERKSIQTAMNNYIGSLSTGNPLVVLTSSRNIELPPLFNCILDLLQTKQNINRLKRYVFYYRSIPLSFNQALMQVLRLLEDAFGLLQSSDGYYETIKRRTLENDYRTIEIKLQQYKNTINEEFRGYFPDGLLGVLNITTAHIDNKLEKLHNVHTKIENLPANITFENIKTIQKIRSMKYEVVPSEFKYNKNISVKELVSKNLGDVIKFLKDFKEDLNKEISSINYLIERIKTILNKDYETCKGKLFPIKPMIKILDSIENDINLASENSELYKMLLIGNFSKIWSELDSYKIKLSDTDEKSDWKNFVDIYKIWEVHLQNRESFEPEWQYYENYFKDAPSDIISKFNELNDIKIVSYSDITMAVEAGGNTLNALENEVKSRIKKFDKLKTGITTLMSELEKELKSRIDSTKMEIVNTLLERIERKKAFTGEGPFSKKTYIEQYEAVNKLNQDMDAKGIKFAGDENYWEKYQELYKKVKIDKLPINEGDNGKISVLSEKGLIDVRITYSIEF